jgi:hypothetical protein
MGDPFTYSAGRSSETPLMLLDGFKGALMSDGYTCYKKSVTTTN